MKNIMRYIIWGGLLSILLSWSVQGVNGQEATARLKELLPKMAAADPTNEEQVKEMGQAQVDWMDFCLQKATALGNESLRNEVNAAMLQALAAEGKVEAKAWLLHLLAWTGTDNEVDALAAFLLNDEIRLADEAARSLSVIRTEKSLKALATAAQQGSDKQKSNIAAALADTTKTMVVGTESVLPMSLPYVSDAEVKKWLQGFNTLSTDDQVRTLTALTARGNAEYLPIAREALASSNADLVRAAILAVGKLGTERDMIRLTRFLVPSPHRDIALLVISRYPSAAIDAPLLKTLTTTEDNALFLGLATVLTNRAVVDAFAPLMQRATQPEASSRLEIVLMAEKIASKENVGQLIDTLFLFTSGSDRDKVEQAITRLVQGDVSPIIAKLNGETGAILLPLIGRIGGKQALEQIDSLLKSTEPNTAALAVRSLCNWPDATVAKKLLEIAESEGYQSSSKIQALRAFVRVISLPDDQIGMKISTTEKVELLKKAMSLATRKDEQTLILNRLGAIRDTKVVELALGYLDNPELAETACQTINALAHHAYLRTQAPELFRRALEAVLKTSKDNGTIDKAKTYLAAM